MLTSVNVEVREAGVPLVTLRRCHRAIYAQFERVSFGLLLKFIMPSINLGCVLRL